MQLKRPGNGPRLNGSVEHHPDCRKDGTKVSTALFAPGISADADSWPSSPVTEACRLARRGSPAHASKCAHRCPMVCSASSPAGTGVSKPHCRPDRTCPRHPTMAKLPLVGSMPKWSPAWHAHHYFRHRIGKSTCYVSVIKMLRCAPSGVGAAQAACAAAAVWPHSSTCSTAASAPRSSWAQSAPPTPLNEASCCFAEVAACCAA